jgi:hypothetical protein
MEVALYEALHRVFNAKIPAHYVRVVMQSGDDKGRENVHGDADGKGLNERSHERRIAKDGHGGWISALRRRKEQQIFGHQLGRHSV